MMIAGSSYLLRKLFEHTPLQEAHKVFFCSSLHLKLITKQGERQKLENKTS